MSKYVQDNEWGVKYKNFRKEEFKCPCCGGYGVGIASSLVENLQKLRDKYGSLIITSGYRCLNYNKKVGGIAGSQHTKGQAADFYFGSGILVNQNTRINVVNEIKGMPNYHYAYCNVNGNYPNMGSAIHMDTLLTGDNPNTKSIDELAREVIAGKWGNGEERKKRINEAGYDYNLVQKRVNELVNGNSKKYILVNARLGVWCRTGGYGFSAPKYKVIPNQTKCELLAKNVGYANGYNWDKVIYEGKTVYLPNAWNKYL